ncbi:DUF6691 family protein [Maricaulis sp.]|uniref:DUF6691 family protein n=1 Tax=Maricaulis sp. TaxID=1486257 RepID=UPI0025BB4F11|nr:DUF6691 family protein [Maricaulis sp.]
MMRNLAAGLAGLIFGLGLVIAQMTNPAKVLAFLDIFGAWDPSLALVMGSALAITAIGYRLAWRRAGPVLGGEFALPSASQIDVRLAAGAVMFGAGWGLVGLCPGPALTALTIGGPPVWIFGAAMLAGMVAFRFLPAAGAKPA